MNHKLYTLPSPFILMNNSARNQDALAAIFKLVAEVLRLSKGVTIMNVNRTEAFK